MNILYISFAYGVKSSNLYSDLGEELVARNHKVTVVTPSDSIKKSSESFEKGGVKIVTVKTPKRFDVNPFRKAYALLCLPSLLKKYIKQNLLNEKFDLILSEAPPVTLWKTVAWAKNKFKCKSFLQQKDIFPANACDIGMLSKKNPAYWYYRQQEISMLKTADYVGCMSEANIKYLIKHNPKIDASKFIYFPNTVKILDAPVKNKRAEICVKFGIDENACIFLFGGNLGYSQYVEYFCQLLDLAKNDKNIFFLIIGSGVHAKKIANTIKDKNIKNAIFMPYIPREEYMDIAANVDVGLSILNPNYTIPNYPSKILGYMQSAIPIVAATDINTDFKNLITDQACCGFWNSSSSLEDFYANIQKISSDKNLRFTLGQNGREYLENHFDVKRSVKILENLF